MLSNRKSKLGWDMTNYRAILVPEKEILMFDYDSKWVNTKLTRQWKITVIISRWNPKLIHGVREDNLKL